LAYYLDAEAIKNTLLFPSTTVPPTIPFIRTTYSTHESARLSRLAEDFLIIIEVIAVGGRALFINTRKAVWAADTAAQVLITAFKL
jgi:hypothetical protein